MRGLKKSCPLHCIIRTGDVHTTEVECYINETRSIPCSLDLTATVTYLNAKGVPTVVTSVAPLPLRLVVKPCPPIKDADYKITISTNKPAVSLLDLFPGEPATRMHVFIHARLFFLDILKITQSKKPSNLRKTQAQSLRHTQ